MNTQKSHEDDLETGQYAVKGKVEAQRRFARALHTTLLEGHLYVSRWTRWVAERKRGISASIEEVIHQFRRKTLYRLQVGSPDVDRIRYAADTKFSGGDLLCEIILPMSHTVRKNIQRLAEENGVQLLCLCNEEHERT